MTQFWHYWSPRTNTDPGFDVDLGGPRLGNIPGLVETALMGEAGISGQEFDDPNGTLGHSGDAIVGLKTLFVVETDCPAVGGTSAAPTFGRRLYTSYTADRTYRRGTPGDSGSLITGGMRTIDISTVDVNTYLQWRVYRQSYTSANRPAETDAERIAFFMGYQFIATQLFDLGLVNLSNPVALDAVDYRGQRPFNWLDDCAQASGKNFFVYWSEKDQALGLFYDTIGSSAYPADLALSNVLSECDQNTTFAIASAELFRDPARVSTGVYLPFANGTTYQSQPTTADTFGWRDAIAPSANVKTLTKANALALRYLSDNDTEDDKITCLVRLPSNRVTGIKAGQRLSAHFSHLPGYESGFANFRVLRRTVRQDFETPLLYMVELELTPISPLPGPPVSDGGWASNTTDQFGGYLNPGLTEPGVIVASGSEAVLVGMWVVSQAGITFTPHTSGTATPLATVLDQRVFGSFDTGVQTSMALVDAFLSPVPTVSSQMFFLYGDSPNGTGNYGLSVTASFARGTGAYSLVQHTSAASATVSPSSTPTAGNLLVLGVGATTWTGAAAGSDIPVPTGWTRVLSRETPGATWSFGSTIANVGANGTGTRAWGATMFYKVSDGTETTISVDLSAWSGASVATFIAEYA